MNSPSVILASIALSSVAAVTTAFYVVRPAPETSPVSAAAFAEMQGTVAELTKANTALQGKLEAMSKTAAPAVVLENDRVAVPAVSNEQVAAAVEAYLKRRGNGQAASGDGSGAADFDIERDFKDLIGTSYWENSALWKKALAAGAMDDVVKKLEEMAKANPGDIPTQMKLANACLAYLQMDQSKWQLSQKADQAYDKVLELDNTHWQARFSKAVSYSFWPKLTGKPKEAIKHLEMLVTQQEKMPVEAQHAQTYLILGNLLEESDPARARQMWQQGARRHPDNQELAKKVGN